jgi:ribitol 2-dehydrogenase
MRGTFQNMFAPPSLEYQDEIMRPTVKERPEFRVETALDMRSSYTGKHVIVTGASGAIGAEVSRILIESGAKVVLFGRDAKKLSKGAASYSIELTDNPLDLESKFRQAMKDLKGVLHSLIICHGNQIAGGIRTLNLKLWDRSMIVNVRSVFMITSLAIPFLKLQKKENPSVCIISGDAGFDPYPGFTALSVAKAMINSFIECAALEMAYHGIRINGVAPAFTNRNFELAQGTSVKTNGIDKTLYISEDQIPFKMHPYVREELEEYPAEKIIEAEEVADVAVWL